jgi:hypothetical protein
MPFQAAAEFCISCAGRKKNHPSLRKPTPQKSMKKQRTTIVQFASQKAALHDGNIATMKPTNGTKLLSLAAAVLLTDTCMASTVLVGSLTPFTGAGAGQGIVLAPSTDIVYALNLGGPTLLIQGQTFTGATAGGPPTGVSVTGGLQYNYATTNPSPFLGTDYGANPSDGQNLDTMLSTTWYGTTMTVSLAVTVGQQYKLQLLLQEPHEAYQHAPLNSTHRIYDISVENSLGSLVLGVDEFVPGVETNGAFAAGADFGLVYTYSFTASDTSYSFQLADSPSGIDGNAPLGALVLTQIPEPSTALLGGLGFLALLRRRR